MTDESDTGAWRSPLANMAAAVVIGIGAALATGWREDALMQDRLITLQRDVRELRRLVGDMRDALLAAGIIDPRAAQRGADAAP